MRVWARNVSGINTCFGLSALIILCHPWRSSRELCSHQDSGDDAMDAGKQLSLKAKKESTQQMAAPAQGSLSVKQLDAMAAARTKQHGAASSAQAEASDDDTEDGDPQVPRKVRALAAPLSTLTVPHAANAVATPARCLPHRHRAAAPCLSATPKAGDRGADGAESGPSSGEKAQRRATSAGGAPPDAGGKPKKAQMKSGKVDQILKDRRVPSPPSPSSLPSSSSSVLTPRDRCWL